MPPLGQQPLTNQQSQIFGSFLADDLPNMQPLMPDMTGQVFPDNLLLDDSLDGKRRRIARVGLLHACRTIYVLRWLPPSPD